MNSWKKISSEVRLQNPWWSYALDTFETAGLKREYHYVHHTGSAMTVPVLPDGRLVLIRQYRYLMDRPSVEFPCGGVEEGETFAQAAARELAEETGLVAADLINIGQFCPCNGMIDEWCRLFLARGLRQTESSPESTEEIEILTRRLDEVEAMIRQGEIWDGQTLSAWALVRDAMKHEG